MSIRPAKSGNIGAAKRGWLAAVLRCSGAPPLPLRGHSARGNRLGGTKSETEQASRWHHLITDRNPIDQGDVLCKLKYAAQ